MSKQSPAAPNADRQSIEELQKRYERLNTRKIQAGANLDNARGQLEALKEDARKTYGTDDVAELRAKRDAMKADNETKRKNYQAEIDQIEGALATIEERIATTEKPSADRQEQQ